jgi:hypothetical protein
MEYKERNRHKKLNGDGEIVSLDKNGEEIVNARFKNHSISKFI